MLVVDDDARTARLLARMLREDGFDVELALDGAMAIARLGRSPMPDVLVTDISMPHADGIAVSRYARSRSPNLPIVLVTGYPELVPNARNALVPSPTVFTKPLDYAKLSAALQGITPGPETAR